jgi:hypothetical protein
VNPGRLGGLPITQPGGSRLEEIRLASISNPFEFKTLELKLSKFKLQACLLRNHVPLFHATEVLVSGTGTARQARPYFKCKISTIILR